MITVKEINGFKSRIYSLRMMKAEKSLAILKQTVIATFAKESEENQQWIADQWFGRLARKSYQDVIAELTN